MDTATTHLDGSGWYEIRLLGRLEPRWSAHFEGMTLTTGDGITLLAGPVVDQSAQPGLLHQLRDIGLPLLSVCQVETAVESHPPHHSDTTSSGA